MGFDGTTGAISGDDGERYSFVQASWRGDRLPQAHDAVDFVAVADAATDIYPLRLSLGDRLNRLGDGTVRERLARTGARTLLVENPQIVILGIAILASILLGFVRNASMSGGSVSLVHFPGMIGAFRSQVSQLGGVFEGQVGTGSLWAASVLAYLLWFIPIGAAFLVFRDMTGRRSRRLEIALGALCVASGVICRFCIAALDSHPGLEILRALGALSLRFGAGGYLIVLCGIGLILTGLGRLTRIPGTGAASAA